MHQIIPIIELALLIFSEICASMLSDESKVTPISLTVSALLIVFWSLPIVYPSFLMEERLILMLQNLSG